MNVANLGRKPYRSLAGDVVPIVQDELHLLLRGEVIWRKGPGLAPDPSRGAPFNGPGNPCCAT